MYDQYMYFTTVPRGDDESAASVLVTHTVELQYV